MTDDKMALRELLEKGSDASFLREMIGFAAQRLMELETEGLCGAGHGERSADRRNQRNGYRERDWETRAGTVELRIPKLRKGSYFPGFFEPRRTAEKALTAVIQEAYMQGVSTRSVDLLVQAMGDERHLQKSGVAAVRRDRWQGRDLPDPAAGRRRALCLAECHLCKRARGRTHRRRGCHHRGRRQQRWQPG